MPCRTRLRPAAPSSVSSGWASIQPSWWLTVSTSTARRQSPTHQDTSGLRTGESRTRRLWGQRERESYFQKVTQCCCPSPTYSSGVFEIAEANGVQQGTKIVLHLKDDCKEFSSEDRVKGAEPLLWAFSLHQGHDSSCIHCVMCLAEVVTKYSNFVSFPIFLNGRRLNTLQVRCLAVVNVLYLFYLFFSRNRQLSWSKAFIFENINCKMRLSFRHWWSFSKQKL